MKNEFTRIQVESFGNFILDKAHSGMLNHNKAEDLLKEWELKHKSTDDISVWVDDWLDLWPNIKNAGGKKLRSDREVCTNRLREFITKTNHLSIMSYLIII